jgi:hypothetical protein
MIGAVIVTTTENFHAGEICPTQPLRWEVGNGDPQEMFMMAFVA